MQTLTVQTGRQGGHQQNRFLTEWQHCVVQTKEQGNIKDKESFRAGFSSTHCN
jgi:hypothetical protein